MKNAITIVLFFFSLLLNLNFSLFKNTDLICSFSDGGNDTIFENNFGLNKIFTVCNLL